MIKQDDQIQFHSILSLTSQLSLQKLPARNTAINPSSIVLQTNQQTQKGSKVFLQLAKLHQNLPFQVFNEQAHKSDPLRNQGVQL